MHRTIWSQPSAPSSCRRSVQLFWPACGGFRAAPRYRGPTLKSERTELGKTFASSLAFSRQTPSLFGGDVRVVQCDREGIAEVKVAKLAASAAFERHVDIVV